MSPTFEQRAFGDYTLLKPLGKGGMGQVFLARLRGRGLAGVDKFCVVKTLKATDDPEYERRFIDEARLIVLLSHKNICPVFDAGCIDGGYYLALEHIDGRDVRQAQLACERRGVPLPDSVVIHIVKETLEALDAAHRMGHPITHEPLRVVHRDVSPQNVMISKEGEVKLIDFGLAVSSQKLERTAPQIVMGKMAYMAPEQARGEPVDARADQFAVGVMLYELLTNDRYYGSLPIDSIWRLSGRGGHVPDLLGNLDEGLSGVITRATAAQKSDRFASCADMRDALTQIELRRGVLAGSRELRAALQTLDEAGPPRGSGSHRIVGDSGGEPPANVPVVAKTELSPPAVSTEPSQAPRERTRTFRISPESAGGMPSVIDLSGDDQRVATAATAKSVASPSPPPPSQRRPEATVLVRTAAEPPVPWHRTPAIVAAVGIAIVVAVVGLRATSTGPAPPPVSLVAPPPPVTPVASLPPPSPPARAPGSIVAAPEPPPPEPAVVPPEPAPPPDQTAPTKRPHSQRKPRRREVPPLPDGDNKLPHRNKLLQEHCGDLPCAKGLTGESFLNLAERDRGAADKHVRACFAQCGRTPRP